MEVPIQKLEEEFDYIIASNQEKNIPGEEKNIELTTNVSKADLELNILLEADKRVELDDVDLKKNHRIVDVTLHASDFDRSSPFNDDLQMDSNKKIELLEMQTQVAIHNENSNTKHNSDTTISQPNELESSLSIRDGEMNAKADEYLTVIKLLKPQTHTSLNGQVLCIKIFTWNMKYYV